MKEDSKNIRRRKLINLIKDHRVGLNIILIYVEISKVSIDIIFKRPKFKLILNIRFPVLYLFSERNNKDYIYFLKSI